MALPVKTREPEVTFIPRGRNAVTLEGGFDAIYEQLRVIKTDAQLVPHAKHPVDLGGGRCRVEVTLTPGPALATAKPETAQPKRTRLRLPRLRLPQWERSTWSLIGWWSAAAASLAVTAGAVWGAVIAVQALAAFLSVWMVPVALIGMALLAVVGVGLERHNAAQAQAAQFNAQIMAAQAAGEPMPIAGQSGTTTAQPTATPHWFTGKPISGPAVGPGAGVAAPQARYWFTGKPIHGSTTNPVAGMVGGAAGTAPATHWLSGKPISGSTTYAVAEPAHHWLSGKPISESTTGVCTAGPVNSATTSGTRRGSVGSTIHIEDAEPATHWFTSRPLNDAAEAQAAHEAQWSQMLAPPEPTYNWYGGKSQETKERERQEKLAQLSPLAQRWVSDLRDPKNQRRQARGTYADGSGSYCAVGLETKMRGDITHKQMCREFGKRFVRDVEHRNDNTRATFADLASYIEDHCA